MAKLIELIKELNVRTGAGLMDCKKALLENEENIEKAITWLREKGIAKQAKKEGRIAAEGLTYAVLSKDNSTGVIIEFNSETDFVAKSDPFKNLVTKTAEIILTKKYTTIEQVQKDAAYTELYNDSCMKLGEKLSLRRFEFVKAAKGNSLSFYIHMQGKISVLIESNGSFDLGKEIAMNIAANNPTYISKDQISAEAIANETEVQKALTLEQDKKFNEKKPEVQEKIISGKVNKILFEQVLTEEALIKTPEKTVGQLLSEKKVTISKFTRYQVGEGLAKREENFADEVMAQAK